MSAADDADGFMVDLQADGARELALDALCRGCQRARATTWSLLLRAELGARRNKAPKHRHHGAGEDLQLPDREEAVQLFKLLLACTLSVQQFEYIVQTWHLFNKAKHYLSLTGEDMPEK